MKRPKTGELRHRLILKSKTQTPDGQGGFTNSFSTFNTIWGQVEPLTAYEQMQAAKLWPRVSHKIRIRYLSGVLANMTVTHDNRTFKIHGIKNIDERKVWLELMCEEGAGI